MSKENLDPWYTTEVMIRDDIAAHYNVIAARLRKGESLPLKEVFAMNGGGNWFIWRLRKEFPDLVIGAASFSEPIEENEKLLKLFSADSHAKSCCAECGCAYQEPTHCDVLLMNTARKVPCPACNG